MVIMIVIAYIITTVLESSLRYYTYYIFYNKYSYPLECTHAK